jgi:hypothetical protein
VARLRFSGMSAQGRHSRGEADSRRMWGPSKDGDAAYYSLSVDGRTAENAAIKEYLAFYPARVDRIEEVGEEVERASK